MSGVFQFKQFSVDQTGCAMKINTDGVLLGALAEVNNPGNILDIGTGTGVIALMLAQRFLSARIDAVEIDETAATTAIRNFQDSLFANRLSTFPVAIHNFFTDHPEKKYDLIVSNPPFYINSLESSEAKKSLARHTRDIFFKELIKDVAGHLSEKGLCWLVLPLQTATLVKELSRKQDLYLQKVISIYSFNDDLPHREILVFGKEYLELKSEKFVIYNEPKIYTEMYKKALKDFFTIF